MKNAIGEAIEAGVLSPVLLSPEELKQALQYARKNPGRGKLAVYYDPGYLIPMSIYDLRVIARYLCLPYIFSNRKGLINTILASRLYQACVPYEANSILNDGVEAYNKEGPFQPQFVWIDPDAFEMNDFYFASY